MAISLYGEPKNRDLLAKVFKVTRTDTTASIKAYLPKDAVLAGAYVLGGPVSNAGTTGTLSVGTTSTSNEIVSAFNLITNGVGYVPVGTAGTSLFGTKLTADTPIYAKYAETGTASNAGGPWEVKLEYYIPGPGEKL